MNKTLKASLAGAILAVFACFTGLKPMKALVSSYEVPAYQVVLKSPLSKDFDHLVSLRHFNDETFTCTQDELLELRQMKNFLKTTDVYVQRFDYDSLKCLKSYEKKFKGQGYEVIYSFEARPHKSKL